MYNFKSTYSEKLKDPRWQKKRLEVFQRDNFKCQYCGNGESTLHVHHAYYVAGREPWEYDLSALKTMCADCHAWETNHLYQMQSELIQLLKEKAGYVSIDFELLYNAFNKLSDDKEAINALGLFLMEFHKHESKIKDYLKAWQESAQ